MSTNYLDVSFLFKRKLIEKLMGQFQKELSALMEDAGYKTLKPEEQMFAISELTHWWSLWFQKIPDPMKEVTNDFQDVKVDETVNSEFSSELKAPYWVELLRTHAGLLK